MKANMNNNCENSEVPSSIEICGIKMHNTSMQEAVEKIMQLALYSHRKFVFTPNVDHILKLQKNEKFKAAYKSADLVLADGIPFQWAAQFQDKSFKEIISGSNLVEKIIEVSEVVCLKIVLMGGSKKNTAMNAKNILLKKYPKANIQTLSPEFGLESNQDLNNDQFIEQMNEIQPDILILCADSPNTEIWINENIDKMSIGVVLSLGATLDHITQEQKKAPLWIQKRGLEWAYRAFRNPKMFWNRSFSAYMKFSLYLVKYYLLKKDIAEESEMAMTKKNILPLPYVTATFKEIVAALKQIENQLFNNEEAKLKSSAVDCDLLIQRIHCLFNLCPLKNNLFALKVKSEAEQIYNKIQSYQKDLATPLIKVG